MIWPQFWAIQIMLLVLILMYCTARELMRVIGRDKVRRIFFGPMPAPDGSMGTQHATSILPLTASLAAVLAAARPCVRAGTAAPADPWPRTIALSNAAVVIYQPQVESWDGNQIQVRAAVSIKPAGAPAPSFGAVFATARTEVDRVARTVVFNDLAITKSNFPTLPDQGAAYAAELKSKLGAATRTISLDRVEASLKAAGVKAPSFPVKNDPPRVIVSNTPAILVPIDGAPVIKPLPDDSRFKRVINTRALMLQGGLGDSWYLHVYDGWLSASSLDGPWTKAGRTPIGMDDVAQEAGRQRHRRHAQRRRERQPEAVAGQRRADDLHQPGADRADRLQGQPQLRARRRHAAVGQQQQHRRVHRHDDERLLRAAVGPLVPRRRHQRAVELRARQRLAAGLRAHPDQLAGRGGAGRGGRHAAGAGSGDRQLDSADGDGAAGGRAELRAELRRPAAVRSRSRSTPLSATTNASVPIIQVDPGNYFAVSSGVWFTAPAVTGPWRVATSVPNVIYTIPTSSVVHFVTYVRIYGATPEVVYVGYTPGYMGTVVGPYGTVVYGTGYTYAPWVGSVWYPPPYTYGVAAVPVYSAALGFTYGFATGLATAAWVTPYYGAAYHPYACCGSATASVYGQYGNTAYSGTKTAYAGGGVAGVSGSGSYYNKATGTSRQLFHQQELQRQHRRGQADRRGQRHGRGGRHRHARRRAAATTPRPASASVRIDGFGHRRRRQQHRPHRRDDGRPAGLRPHRLDDDHQRQDRRDQDLGLEPVVRRLALQRLFARRRRRRRFPRRPALRSHRLESGAPNDGPFHRGGNAVPPLAVRWAIPLPS